MTTPLIPDAPAVPDSSVAEPTFDAQFEAFLQWQKSQLVPGINAVLPVLDQAVESSAAAIAAASYKGLWSALSGPLNIPASASHAGQLWMLLSSVANVAAEEPGVSLKWLAIGGTPKFDLISTTNAAAVASVEWTNFDTLAATYDHLVLQASGVLGSAATATLTGQVRQSGAWQTATWSGMDVPAALAVSALSLPNQLTNVAKQAMALQLHVRQLSATAVRHIDYASHGGATTAMVLGYSSFSHTGYTPTTPIQGLRIYASTGNVSGTFRLYGVRK